MDVFVFTWEERGRILIVCLSGGAGWMLKGSELCWQLGHPPRHRVPAVPGPPQSKLLSKQTESVHLGLVF